MAAKRAEVEDSTLALKEDPAMFSEMLQERALYKFEYLMNESSGKSSRKLSEEMWDETAWAMIYWQYHNLVVWQAISSELQKLLDINAQPSERQRATETTHVRRRLLYLVGMLLLDYLGWLSQSFAACPGLRNYVSLGKDRLVRAQFREITILLSEDPSQKQRLSAELLRIISDLAVLAELERQLVLISFNGRRIITPGLADIHEEMREEMVYIYRMETLEDRGAVPRVLHLAPLTKTLRFVDYLSDKPPSAVSNEKMRKAERDLDHFWEGVSEVMVAKLGKSLLEIEKDRLDTRPKLRTPPWVEPVEPSPTPSEQRPPEDLPTSILLLDLQERSEQTTENRQHPQPRIKVKSRGEPAAPNTSELPQKHQETQPPSTNKPDQKIPVSNKVLRAFSSLFYIPSADTAPGELPWKDFVHAMSHVGFSAQKLAGSAWVFRQRDKNLPEKILFHEPHPDSKIPSHFAARMAWRLRRSFGWTGETFVRAADVVDQGQKGG